MRGQPPEEHGGCGAVGRVASSGPPEMSRRQRRKFSGQNYTLDKGEGNLHE